MDMNNTDLIFSGTKDVAENLKFDEAGLQEWFGDHIPETGKIIQVAQFKPTDFSSQSEDTLQERKNSAHKQSRQ